jgi:hypothetical protein
VGSLALSNIKSAEAAGKLELGGTVKTHPPTLEIRIELAQG